MHGTLRFMDSILYGFKTVILASESMQLTPCATKTVFCLVIMQDFQSFGYLAYTCITYDLNYSIVCLSERYEKSFEENVWARGVCKSKKRGLLITYCNVCNIVFQGHLVRRAKIEITVPETLWNSAY